MHDETPAKNTFKMFDFILETIFTIGIEQKGNEEVLEQQPLHEPEVDNTIHFYKAMMNNSK